MPELPEVETIKRQLADKVIGLTIKNVLITNANSFKGDPKKLQGLEVRGVSRRAKMVIIKLDNHGIKPEQNGTNTELFLLIHLKMTGQLIFVDSTVSKQHGASKYSGIEVPNKFTHVSFEFTDGSYLYFNDVRKFGWIKLVKSKELEQEFEKLGPEPLSGDFTVEILKQNLLKHKNKAIKVVLMDPSVVAGIGNIYAAEACFYARIRPDRKVLILTDQDFRKLYGAIKKILPIAIKHQGVSAENYVTLEGKKGDYYNMLRVYDREGEDCPNKCGGKINKTKLGGRGTYWCPNCQR